MTCRPLPYLCHNRGMHTIQKQILARLTFHPGLRYSEIKPTEMEGNLFTYHLNLLIKNDLIAKTGEHLYDLSPHGRRYVDKLSLKHFRPRVQPKIVTLIVCKNDKNEYLLYKRHHQPFYGMCGFPYGKTHLGENLVTAATRELTEKTDLVAHLTHRGDVYLVINDQGELLAHMLCHIFTTSRLKGALRPQTTMGKCFWAKLPLTNGQLMPGVMEIYNLLRKHKSTQKFWAEYRLDM
nr:hypothetical protein [uncultured bacterium]